MRGTNITTMNRVVGDANKYASLLGYVEIRRAEMLRCLDLHAKDVIYQFLSKVISLQLFGESGTIISREEEEKKKKKQQQEQKSRHDDQKSKRDAIAGYPPSVATKPPQKDDPAKEEEEEEEESLYDEDVTDAWARAIPQLVSCSEAVGIGVAVSQETYMRARQEIEILEGVHPSMLTPIEPTSNPTMTLIALHPSRIRIFFKRDASYDDCTWMVMLPVILRIPEIAGTKEQVKTRLMSSAVLADGAGLDIAWYVLPPESVFVYLPQTSNLPRDDGTLNSHISRCEPERKVEIGNRYCMSASNLVNARPPIALIQKQTSAKRKNASGDDTIENEREFEPLHLTREAQDLETPGEIDAHGKIESFPSDAASLAMVVYRENQKQRREENSEAKTQEQLKHAYDIMEDVTSAVQPTPISRNHWTIEEGREIGQIPPAVPPEFYVEQSLKRIREAASLWGIPSGVLLNYSIMDSSSSGASSGLGSMGGQKEGVGGATSGTMSSAWQIYERTMHAQITSIERFSAVVLKRMQQKRKSDLIERTIKQFVDGKLAEFYDRHGTEEQFSHKLMYSDTDESIKEGLAYQRQQRKSEYLDPDNCKKEIKLPKEASLNDLVFKIPRVQPLQQVVPLWQSGILTSTALIKMVKCSLHVEETDLELPETLDEAREASLNPMPEMAEEKEGEGGEGGGKKKKAKAK
jgi:hypothetical protein